MASQFGSILAHITNGMFETQQGSIVLPTIDSLDVVSGSVGTRVTMSVTNNGSSQGTYGNVFIGTLQASEIAWSDGTVSFTVPQGLNVGNKVITLVTNDLTSAVYSSFEVTASGSSSVSQFFEALRVKLSGSSYITDASNVYIGFESVNIADYKDSDFPRYEVLVTKDKMNGYASQRTADFALRYSVGGYLYRDSEDVEMSDMTNLVEFAMETRRLNYSFIDDKQGGNSPCEGFLMMGGFTETFYEFELFSQVSSFLIDIEANIEITDTEVG